MAPLVDELVAATGQHRLLIGTGGGTRARHAYARADELTGALDGTAGVVVTPT